MAALSTSNLTLADWAKLFDPDGKLAVVTNVLSQTNEVLEDCVFKEANGKTHHRTTIATGLPGVYWRQINQGIPPTKATTAQVDEAIGMLEARSEVDCVMARLSGNVGKFRFGRAAMHLESMGQTQAATMFRGDPTTEPASYLGLQGRYSVLSGAANSQNVIDGGGAAGSDQTSIYLVGWGDESVYCTFPEGSQAGLIHQDLGEQTIYGQGGVTANRMQGFVDLYTWHHGLVVQDWRYCVRICNLKETELSGLSGAQAPTVYTNLMHTMTTALYKLPNINMVRPAFYVNRLVHSALSRMAMEKFSSTLAFQEGVNQFGNPRRYLSFNGVPVRLCDTLTNTEARLT